MRLRHAGFRRDTRGTAAVEFALIAMPLLAVVAAVIQAQYQLWASQNFDRTLQSAVRTIFTGRFQIANAGQTDASYLLAALKTTMCGPANARIANVFSCQNVKIDVATASNLSSATASVPVDVGTGTWTTNFGTNYACAKPGTVVIVTAAVPFPSFFALLGLQTVRFTSGENKGSGLLVSTAVFRTEPYQVTGASAC